MKLTMRTFAITVILPPVAFLILAHMLPAVLEAEWVVWMISLALWLGGLAAIATSKWKLPVQIAAGVIYALLAMPLIPLTALFAVCTTGNCI